MEIPGAREALAELDELKAGIGTLGSLLDRMSINGIIQGAASDRSPRPLYRQGAYGKGNQRP